MISSPDFIFVHVPRTGGWSVTHALKPITTDTTRHHLPFSSAKLKDRWSFGFVRNPWDRIVSLYYSAWNRHKQVGFEEWIENEWPTKIEKHPHIWSASAHFWLDGVDTIYRFEEIEVAWEEIQTRIGHSADLPHLHKRTHPPHPEVHTPRTMEVIRKVCDWEIKKFGYSPEPLSDRKAR